MQNSNMLTELRRNLQGIIHSWSYIFAIPVLSMVLFGKLGIVISILSIASFMLYYGFNLKVKRHFRDSNYEFHSMELFSLISIAYDSGKTARNSISESIKALSKSGNSFVPMVSALPKLMRYVRFNDALAFMLDSNLAKESASARSILHGMLSKFESGSDPINAMRSLRESISIKINSKLSGYLSMIQKYATISMLFSTILPSFGLFGLAGYSILEPSTMIVPIGFALFVVMLPLAYLVVRMNYSVIYNAMA